MNKRDRILIMILCLCLGAAVVFATIQSLDTMDSYIKENGRQNMDTVINQMRQSYDVQMREYYIDLRQIDAYLFRNKDRSIQLDAYEAFFDARKKSAYDKLLFLKEDGAVLTEDGVRSRIELREQLLDNLRSHKNVTKLVTWEDEGQLGYYYLVAIPCTPYYVDGERYTALGALYAYSRIESMLVSSSYVDGAYLFLVDEQGIVSFSNQPDAAYLRYYSLLEHMLEENAITQKDYDYLFEKRAEDEQEVLLLGENDRPFYLGYAPLRESDSRLVCIAPAYSVNNVLVNYRKNVVRFSVILTVFIIAMCGGLLYIVFRLRESEQKVSFEEKNRQIQAQAIEALEVEKSRAELANQAKGQFLSRMSHDVRIPMNVIVGTMDLIAHDAEDPDKVRSYVQQVQATCRHFARLVNDVLDMSWIGSTEAVLARNPINWAEELERLEKAAGQQIQEKGQRFEIHAHHISHEYLLADEARLRQIFLNLLSNASKFTPGGGSISLELTEQPCKQQGYGMFTLSVSDTGCGMTEDFLQRVFEPFARADNAVTNKVKGTGLGLAITKSVIDMMGGTIRAESKPGVGSTFTVTLPLELDPDARYQISAQSVLLVTGDVQLVEDVRSALHCAGVRLETAATAVQAEKLIKENQPDVIILSGYSSDRDFDDAVRWVRMHSNNCPLVFCYGYRRLMQEQRLFPHCNIDGVITGPFFFETFAGLVNQARGDVVQAGGPFSLAGMRFLCAEDNRSNREVLTALLEMEGASCQVYPDGAALVTAFDDAKQGDYDAILMDVQMPVMNGLEATRVIRTGGNPLGRTIPIIAMTADVSSEDVRVCLKAGMTAHVPKPLDLDVLKRTLGAILAPHPDGDDKGEIT